MTRGQERRAPEPTEQELVAKFVGLGWGAWVFGAVWGVVNDIDLEAGAQVAATLIVAIAFATSFIKSLNDLTADGGLTWRAAAALIGLIALAPLLGLAPAAVWQSQIVVGGASFAGVIVAFAAGVLASLSRSTGD